MKKIFLSIILAILLVLPATFALDGSVAYIYRNTPNNLFVAELQNLGLSVDLVRYDFVPTTNFSQYSMIFVNNEFFPNANQIPVNQFPTMLATGWNLDVWHWSDTSSIIASNSPLYGNVTNNTHMITDDYALHQLLQVYDSCCEGLFNLNMLYLGRQNRNPIPRRFPSFPVLNNVFGTELDPRDSIIATAVIGTELRDGVQSNAKGAYFGMIEVAHWTDDTRTLFQESVRWLITDEIAPTISNLQAQNTTNQSTKISFTTNKVSTETLYYGTNQINLDQQVNDLTLETIHLEDIVGLNPGTQYYYKVHSCNKFDYCTDSAIQSFITKKNAPESVNGLFLSVRNSDQAIIIDWNDNAQAQSFRLYEASTPTSFDFSAPTETLILSTFIDLSAPTAQQRFYIVRAVNDEGTEETNMNIVGKFDFNLVKGANLVSLPLNPFDNSIVEIMHEDPSYYPVVEIKEADADSFMSTVFDVNFGPTFWQSQDGLSLLENNKAYYFVSKENTKFTIVGSFVNQQQTIQLHQGLNHIGFMTFNSISLLDLFDGNSYQDISRRHITGNYETATYYPATDIWFSPQGFSTISTGKGYILKVSQDIQLTYNP